MTIDAKKWPVHMNNREVVCDYIKEHKGIIFEVGKSYRRRTNFDVTFSESYQGWDRRNRLFEYVYVEKEIDGILFCKHNAGMEARIFFAKQNQYCWVEVPKQEFMESWEASFRSHLFYQAALSVEDSRK